MVAVFQKALKKDVGVEGGIFSKENMCILDIVVRRHMAPR